jgi:transcriptional regulator with XRE-family HTH domain
MESSVLIKFGQRIRALRKARKLTQKQLAVITGFHYNYIGMVERGERDLRLTNIELFASAFDMSLSELFNI